MSESKKYVWHIGPQPRYTRHYGHFIRDVCMGLHYVMPHDKEFDCIYILQRGGRHMSQTFLNFLNKIYDNKIKYVKRAKSVQGIERLTLTGCLMRDNVFGGNCSKHTKLVANDLRDLSLKKCNIKTKIKNQILFCPRKQHKSVRNLTNYDGLLTKIKNETNCEIIIWYNEDHTIEEQMQAFAESKVIIFASGTDSCNVLWCNENNRVIEIIPNEHYSGQCGAYHNDNIESYLKEKYKKSKWTYTPIRGNNKRDWHFIKLPAENTIILEREHKHGINGKAYEFYLSEHHENKIINLVKEVIV